jgi:hypothetical protein
MHFTAPQLETRYLDVATRTRLLMIYAEKNLIGQHKQSESMLFADYQETQPCNTQAVLFNSANKQRQLF